jgi:hypothetical protein
VRTRVALGCGHGAILPRPSTQPKLS